jgi:hypothetical protein
MFGLLKAVWRCNNKKEFNESDDGDEGRQNEYKQ